MNSVSNPFLSLIMAAIRHDRPALPSNQPFFNRIEKVSAGLYGEVWFRTAGCSWDHQGSCTMCNYGSSNLVDSHTIVESVKLAIQSLDQPVDELLVSPSGSMLDSREVPEDARLDIFKLIADYPSSMVLIETRSELVTSENMLEFRNSQPIGRRIAIEIGLESSDPWIRRFCINKGDTLDDFTSACRHAHNANIEIYANVCLGTAFLNPLEAIEDSVSSIRWALNNGADRVVLFPLHIKPYTLLDILKEKNAYSAPSLWSLVEVLARIGPELIPYVEIAWYRSYYDNEKKVLFSPDSCPECREKVLEHLDCYRATQSFEIIENLKSYNCSCRDEWLKTISPEDQIDLTDRVEAAYKELASTFNLDDWFATKGAELMKTLRDSTHHKYKEID